MSIRKLNGKEPIDGILDLDVSDLITDATTTSKGIMQVGNGLDVNSGIVSTTSKQFLKARFSDTGAIASNQNINPSVDVISDGIPYNTSTGVFTLTQGKTYKIEYTQSVRTTNNGDVSVGLHYDDDTRVDNHYAVIGNTDVVRGNPHYVNIINVNSDKVNYKMKTLTLNGSINKISNSGIMIITEL